MKEFRIVSYYKNKISKDGPGDVVVVVFCRKFGTTTK